MPMTGMVGKARGILRAPPGPGEFHHGRYAPCAELSGVIEHFWSIAWDLRGHSPQVRETLPHPNVHLVIERGRTRIHGVSSGRFTRVLEGAGSVFGVKFKAGGFYPLLRQSVATFADGSLPLASVFGADADDLEPALLACPDDNGRIDTATRFLLAHLPAPDTNVARVAGIVAGIVDDRSITSVDALVERHGIGKRALQRLFQQYVGVSPKWVINRYRLHEAIERLAQGVAVDWTTLALDLGYFDQAHFIKDFKKLIGRAPTEYLRATQAAPRDGG